jgi:hypothetical protein
VDSIKSGPLKKITDEIPLARHHLAILIWFFLGTLAHGAMAVAISSNGEWGASNRPYEGTLANVTKEAINECTKRGGLAAQIVATSFAQGSNGAIAKSGSGSNAVFGWAVGLRFFGIDDTRSAQAKSAEDQAIAMCRRRGGTNPAIVWRSWDQGGIPRW